MNTNRIIKFCRQQLDREILDPSEHSQHTSDVIKKIIKFIETDDFSSDDELKSMLDIFETNYISYVNSTYKNSKPFTKYPFTTNEKKCAKEKLIPIIKDFLSSSDNFKNVSSTDFWDFFLKNMDDWRKKHNYNIITLCNNFNVIIHDIMVRNLAKHNGHAKGSSGKPNAMDVLNDLAPTTTAAK